MVQTSRPPGAQSGLATRTFASSLWPRAHHNLPSSYTTFIGRDREMAEIDRLLANVRLLSLAGPPGVGKTRLALEVASQRVEAYPGGVWWVELGRLADAMPVAEAIASTLDLREVPGHPLFDTIAAALRGSSTLLVLDNCEHLLEAASQLVDALLRRCPELRILTTSRQPLGLPGESIWRVSPLPLPDVAESAARAALSAPAVRLLLDRASAARPDFTLNRRNAPMLVSICRRLDGVPLMLELAAARLKTLSADQLASRLADCLDVLATGSPAALPRQRTLRATLDWSYGLLSTEEQAVFRQVSVFAGGFTQEAAEALCNEEAVRRGSLLDLLSGLVEKSLVTVEERDDGVRYRLLETLRMYGAEKLREAGE